MKEGANVGKKLRQKRQERGIISECSFEKKKEGVGAKGFDAHFNALVFLVAGPARMCFAP